MSNDPMPSELESRPQSRREWSGWLRSVVLPLGLVVAIVAGLLYLQANRGGLAHEEGIGNVELPAGLNPTGQTPNASEDRAAPDFILRAPDGETMRLSDLQGQPVIVNFWATWCSTCRAETPDLIQAYETHREAGLIMLGVNLRESSGPIETFIEEFGLSYPVLLDRNGQVAAAWRIGGPNQGVPATYFIDPEGVIRKVVFGYVTQTHMTEGLALIMAEEG